jgi:hypothetical protein
MNPKATSLIHKMASPWRQRLFLFLKLPAAWFSGIRIMELHQERSVVTVNYKWFTKNPFRSTYFACLAMAAEMSSGILAMMQVYKRRPKISMLVVKMEANFLKKATGRTYFTCEAGKDFERIVDDCIRMKEARTYIATAIGRNEQQERVAEFYITWSFMVK